MRKLFAEMWYCGDDECNCSQPQIVERSMEPFDNKNYLPPKIIEEGLFHSQPNIEEVIEQNRWLLEKARQYNVDNLKQIEERYKDLI